MASGLNAPFFVARENGYFDEEGIDGSIQQVAGTLAAQSMVAGQLDITYSGSSAANAIVQGVPLKVIASLNDVSTNIIYTTDPKVTKLEDLVGKTFAVQSLGDSYQEAALLAFAAAGLDPSGVYFVPVGAGNRPSAVASGAVTAGTMKRNEAESIQAKGVKLYELVDLGAKGIAQSSGGVATSDLFIGDHRDALVGYMTAYVKAVLFIRANIEQATDLTIAAPEMAGIDMNRDAMKASITGFYLHDNIPPEMSSSADVQELLLAGKKLLLEGAKEEVTVKDLYDFSFVQEAYQRIKASGWTPGS